MLPSGYANIGSYKAKESVKPSDIVITNKIMEVLKKPKETKVFGKKESSTSNLYERNLTSLT
jgi:hypothetical protein